MYRNTLVISVDILTQFGPETAISMIKSLFNGVPAIEKAVVVSVNTDWKSDKRFPDTNNDKVLKSLPIVVKP